MALKYNGRHKWRADTENQELGGMPVVVLLVQLPGDGLRRHVLLKHLVDGGPER